MLISLGFGLCIVPFVYETSLPHVALDVTFGLASIALSLRRGRITQRYGSWQRFLVSVAGNRKRGFGAITGIRRDREAGTRWGRAESSNMTIPHGRPHQYA
ncbi:MAG: hypothetical protein R3E87_10435 [Burkholderiaceae bacterium]